MHETHSLAILQDLISTLAGIKYKKYKPAIQFLKKHSNDNLITFACVIAIFHYTYVCTI